MDSIISGNSILYWQLGTLLAVVGYFAFMIYALVDVLRSEFRAQHMKLIWVLIILFAPVIGTFIYLSNSRRTKNRLRRFDPHFKAFRTELAKK